ncbi:hypothetical protein [Pseudomonas sp. D3-10]|uniref:hypothetical protein n=1 Tax=Pseudomonas sp. D3-10 TaxID=2817392 RepID=UPI003DA94E52
MTRSRCVLIELSQEAIHVSLDYFGAAREQHLRVGAGHYPELTHQLHQRLGQPAETGHQPGRAHPIESGVNLFQSVLDVDEIATLYLFTGQPGTGFGIAQRRWALRK